MMSDLDTDYIRHSIRLAAESRSNGDHPFGALLVNQSGVILDEAHNTVITDSDVTAHAEMNLVRLTSGRYPEAVMAKATLYTSTEPCAMCAGAIYWSGIGRVVYGLPGAALYVMAGADPDSLTKALAAETVLNSGEREVGVTGLVLADEAAVVHEGFWSNPG